MRRLIALAAAVGLLIGTGYSLMAFTDPADEARIASLETRVTCIEAGVPCPPATATPEPTATAVPATATATEHAHDVGVCGESMLAWHPIVINGCSTGHDHGDAAPAWLTNAGITPQFTHAAGTPNENALPHKHSAMKGFAATFSGVDIYYVAHWDFNPGGHASRFHSYQLWLRDGAGNISHMHGWLDFGVGNATGPQIRRNGCESTEIRPIMGVNDEGCGVVQFESWYSRSGGTYADGGPGGILLSQWMPDFGANIKATFYAGGDPGDPSTWNPTGDLNDVRRLELAWYSSRYTYALDQAFAAGVLPAGWDYGDPFWTTNFGDIVSGPDASVCGSQRTFGTKTYPVVCLEQEITATLTTISFPTNSLQKELDLTGASLPN